jgi:hypothetical protein
MSRGVKFIRRQSNKIVYILARVATSKVSFHIFINIPTCISITNIIGSKMLSS